MSTVTEQSNDVTVTVTEQSNDVTVSVTESVTGVTVRVTTKYSYRFVTALSINLIYFYIFNLQEFYRITVRNKKREFVVW